MLQYVSGGQYLDAVRMVEKYVLHIEVLFAAIDELERAGAESLPQANYAETLFCETATLIMVLSGAQDQSNPWNFGVENFGGVEIHRERIVQALLSLTPDLTSHHKHLMIITLARAMKLKHSNSGGNALLMFLDRLLCFTMDGADPSAERRRYFVPVMIPNGNSFYLGAAESLYGMPFPSIPADHSEGVAYGYRSLSPQCAGQSPTSPDYDLRIVKDGVAMFPLPPSDKCMACLSPIREACVRLGTYQRWHFDCITCITCGKSVKDRVRAQEGSANEESTRIYPSSEAGGGPSPMKLKDFYCGFSSTLRSPFEVPGPPVPRIYCADHAQPELGHVGGFETVSKLEQQAFLLNVAVRVSHFLLLGHQDLGTTTSA